MEPGPGHGHAAASHRKVPRSFKELTPTKAFNPRTFFREMVWKALITRRTGEHQRPQFPKLERGQLALTWIGHASFLVQFNDLKDRKSTRLNSSHVSESRMPSSA